MAILSVIYIVLNIYLVFADDIIDPHPFDPLPCENPNEEFTMCVLPKPCEKTCRNRHIQIFCKAPCYPGCDCIDGYIRDDNGMCIHPSQCDEQKCPPNQVIGCINPCTDNTCENSFFKGLSGRMCHKMCIRGCVCREGWVFKSHDKRCCIPVEKCPICCPINREFKECGPLEPRSCDNLDEEDCSKECNRGCFCREGLVEDGLGNCISPEDCTPKCGENELVDPCVNPCQPTCSDPNPLVCKFLKCNKGCVCKPPYIRDDLSKRCVSRNDCQNTCPANQTYTEAGQGFNCMTCSNYQIVRCAPIEESQCICNSGYVHHDVTGECIRTEDCP